MNKPTTGRITALASTRAEVLERLAELEAESEAYVDDFLSLLVTPPLPAATSV